MSRSPAVFIILAAGQGQRFGSKTPKQFSSLRKRPVLYWSLAKVAKAPEIDQVIVALPKGWTLQKLRASGALPRPFSKPLAIVEGGKTRPESLKRALKAVYPQYLLADTRVFVHDGARPAWPQDWIGKMLSALKRNPKVSGVIPTWPVRETVKRVNGTMETLKERPWLYFSQTPQLVKLKDFLRALEKWGSANYWDEAQVLEEADKKVIPQSGYFFNVKVTYPQDLITLEKTWNPQDDWKTV